MIISLKDMSISDYGFSLSWNNQANTLSTKELTNICEFIKNISFTYTEKEDKAQRVCVVYRFSNIANTK